MSLIFSLFCFIFLILVKVIYDNENKVKYSIVVPCYNSEYFLDDLCIQVYDAFQKILS